MGQTGENLVSKILVCDNDANSLETLKHYFERKQLIGVSCSLPSLKTLLAKNTDLGAVFLGASDDLSFQDVLDIAKEVHTERPELPIFVRVVSGADKIESPYVSLFFTLDKIDCLESAIDEFLFSRVYPVPLIRGIQEISSESLKNVIANVDVTCDIPYLVKDQIIYGELLSLIPIESNWCRGFMMIQTTEQELINLIAAGYTNLAQDSPSFRDVNELLNEVTNLIWGKIKSRYLVDDESCPVTRSQIQVPTLVNHSEKYISFGSKEPQLSFKYTLTPLDDSLEPVLIYQRLIFNLSWEPSLFKESEQQLNDLANSGELEFF